MNAKEIKELAEAFADELRNHLSEDDIAEINKLNAAESSKDACHTHDFCDANAVMLDAVLRHYDMDKADIDLEAWLETMNAAWKLAAAKGFKIQDIREA